MNLIVSFSALKKTLEQVVVIKHSNFRATIAINYFEQQLLLYHIAMIALFYNSKIDITTYTQSSCWDLCKNECIHLFAMCILFKGPNKMSSGQ